MSGPHLTTRTVDCLRSLAELLGRIVQRLEEEVMARLAIRDTGQLGTHDLLSGILHPNVAKVVPQQCLGLHHSCCIAVLPQEGDFVLEPGPVRQHRILVLIFIHQ